MPVKNAGKRGQRELECGPIRHKMHLFFHYSFYLSSCFQTENLPWPDCQSRFLHKLTRFSLQKARDFYSLLVRFTFGDIYAKRPAGPCNGTDPSLRWRFRRPPAPGRWRSPGWPKKSGRVRPPFSPIAPDVPARHWLPPSRHDKQQVVGVAAGIHRLQGMQCAKLRFHDPFAGGRQRSRITLQLTVTNTGDCFGKETVQLYIAPPEGLRQRPLRELKAFSKVALQPGESKVVCFTLSKRDFSYYEPLFHDFYAESGCYHIEIGASSRDIRLKGSVQLIASKSLPHTFSEYSTLSSVIEDPRGAALLGPILQRLTSEAAKQAAGSDTTGTVQMMGGMLLNITHW